MIPIQPPSCHTLAQALITRIPIFAHNIPSCGRRTTKIPKVLGFLLGDFIYILSLFELCLSLLHSEVHLQRSERGLAPSDQGCKDTDLQQVIIQPSFSHIFKFTLILNWGGGLPSERGIFPPYLCGQQPRGRETRARSVKPQWPESSRALCPAGDAQTS